MYFIIHHKMIKFNIAVNLYLQDTLLVFSICALYVAGLDVCEDKSTDCQPCNLQYPVPLPTRENCMKTCQVCTGLENVALNKTANQVSTEFGGVASNAVDGRITGDNRFGNFCTHTEQSDGGTHWWCVDLEKMYSTINVTVYNRVGQYNERLQGFQLNTAPNGQCNQQGFNRSTPCYRDTPDRIIDIYTVDNCNLQSNESISAGTIFIWHKRFITLAICEVEVYAGISCSDGYYSTSSSTCEPCDGCSDNKCNPDTGDCIGVCKSGFYGTKCQQECSEGCETRECTKLDGSCGCANRWYGARCQFQCNAGCKDSICDQNDGKCRTGCNIGYHGDQCNKNCSNGCNNSDCDQNGGRCSEGCIPGQYGDHCDKACSQGCSTSDCERDGTCSCKDGFKDSYCQTPCDVNCRRCDVVSCTVCKPGWYGDDCESRCPTGCKETCNKTSGTCDECKSGLYDDNCESRCPSECKETCNKTSGTCDECQEGAIGLFCNITCGVECRTMTEEEKRWSICKEEDCNKSCSSKCNGSSCEPSTEECTYQCIGGKEADICLKVTPDPVSNMNVLNAGISKICLGWLAKFEGGDEHKFIVQYSTDDKLWANSTPISTQHYCIENLQPDTGYYIRVVARNRYGDSRAVYLVGEEKLRIKTLGKDLMYLIVVATVVPIFVFAVLAIIIYITCIWKAKSKKASPHRVTDMRKTTTNPYTWRQGRNMRI